MSFYFFRVSAISIIFVLYVLLTRTCIITPTVTHDLNGPYVQTSNSVYLYLDNYSAICNYLRRDWFRNDRDMSTRVSRTFNQCAFGLFIKYIQTYIILGVADLGGDPVKYLRPWSDWITGTREVLDESVSRALFWIQYFVISKITSYTSVVNKKNNLFLLEKWLKFKNLYGSLHVSV